MYLFELFDNDSLNMEDEIRQNVMDVLTPMMAAHLGFVTIQQVIDKLRGMRLGISIDRGLIMNILDPDKLKMIDKIEGDRIYFHDPEAPMRSVNQDDAEKDKNHVDDMAKQKAMKNIGKS